MAADILIVDDEPDIRMLIDGVLRDEGYQTRQAANADEAIASFQASAARPCDPGHLAAQFPPRRTRHP